MCLPGLPPSTDLRGRPPPLGLRQSWMSGTRLLDDRNHGAAVTSDIHHTAGERPSFSYWGGLRSHVGFGS